MVDDAPLFRAPEELSKEHASFLDWPAPERLLWKCQSLPAAADELPAEETSRLRGRLSLLIDRAECRGIVSPAQAWVIRQALIRT